MLSLAANAQSYTTKWVYENGRYRTVRVYKKQNLYDRHRNLINVGIGTLAGSGGSALYTYKISPKKKY